MSTPAEEVLDSPQTRPGGPGRLPALDGLRAVAVIAVMLFHTSSAPLAGGYLGVDVFFVLSGFLIAGILLDQWQRTRRIGLTDFWLRRARRLAPALLLLLLAVELARIAVPQATAAQWRGDVLAALTYTTNWFQILTGADYFNQFGTRSPLLHTWSLAIEEQFYLVFAVFLVLVLPRVRTRGLVILLAGVAVLSAGWMAWLGPRDAVWAYYGTGTRVQALLIGALVAVLVRGRPQRWWAPQPSARRAVVGWVSLAGLSLMLLIPISRDWMFSGGFTVAALLSAGVIWSALQPGPLAGVLAWRPLVALGTISYGVYLWHWPVFLWLQTPGEITAAREIWAIVLTVLIAAASYLLLEKPIRERRFTRLPVKRQWGIYAIAAVVVAGLALLPARTVARDADLTWPSAQQVPQTILLGGDSTMLALGTGFPEDRYPQTQVGGPTEVGCGLVTVPYLHNGQTVESPQCAGWPQKWREEVAQREPQAAVVGSLVWDTFDRSVDGRAAAPGTPEFDEPYRQAVREAVTIAGRDGTVPVYVLGVPCMAARIDQEVLNDRRRTAYLSGLVQQSIADLPGAHFVDLAPLTCAADGTGVVMRDGRVLRDDGVHWKPAGAEEVWSLLLSQMAADGVVAGAPS